MILSYFPLIYVSKPHPSRNANNNMFRIVLNRRKNDPDQLAAPILAQEYREFMFKMPYLPLIGGIIVHLIPSLHRKLELKGKSAECAAALLLNPSINLEAYVSSEARSLLGYEQFEDYSEASIKALIVGELPDAFKWVRKREKMIREWQRKIEEYDRRGN
jgi:hypothetical protein